MNNEIWLYIDDLRQPPGKTWLVVRTITEAIAALATMPGITVVSLDHDIMVPEYEGDSALALRVTAQMSGETFEPVARYIALMPKKPRVIFHTGNIPAGERMAKIIGCEFVSTYYYSCDDL